MATQQIDRSIFVTIGPLSSDTGIKIGTLKIDLNLTKTNDQKKNNGTIKIYNLNNETLDKIVNQDEKLGVTIEAGYLGAKNVDVIFIGVVMGIHVEYTRSDVVLNIKVVDGVIGASNAWFSKSYKKNADCIDIINDVIAEMQAVNNKLVKGKVVDIFSVTTTPYKNGFVWNGFAGDCLTRVCADKELHWFISDDVINVITPDTSIQPTHVPYLNVDSGLIGSPRYHEEKTGKRKDKHTEKGIKFKCLLNPEIKVGTEVKIKSRFFDTNYLVKKIVINANNTDGDFTMEVTAINEWL